jgi:UDP-N-acetylglucosamine--N-acetylmuramyl-(pentapeptide) pyrophosphoryl-undecaprenol N-acetylglucosamine transferase
MTRSKGPVKLVLAAGGTGGHIFPALAVALECRRRIERCGLLWIGSARNRERELARAHDISLCVLNVQGLSRSLSPGNVGAMMSFVRAVGKTRAVLADFSPDAVIAFGGYVCAPALCAARLSATPYYLQEQNTVPGMVNRWFAKKARTTFLGFPLAPRYRLKGPANLTRTPVRQVTGTYDDFSYPDGFEREARTVLICGGSQGAASMNEALLETMAQKASGGVQIVWQTGAHSFARVEDRMRSFANVFVRESIADLYPFYARASLVICRAGASTLNEIAFFGRPCIMIPLPWAAENHQWMNAGLVENQGWGVRIEQNDDCGARVGQAFDMILNDTNRYEQMSRKALDNSPANAAGEIVETICRDLGA